MLLIANAGVIRATGDTAPRTWRRLVAYLLQAFAAPASGPLPAPPSARQMSLALRRLQPMSPEDPRSPARTAED
jgi:hypothetical protein